MDGKWTGIKPSSIDVRRMGQVRAFLRKTSLVHEGEMIGSGTHYEILATEGVERIIEGACIVMLSC